MTLEGRTMNSIYDLQFLNLDDASEKEKEDIINILYGDARTSIVELPWELPSVNVSKYEKNDDGFTIADPNYSVQNYPPPSEGITYQAPFSDQGYPVVCVSHGCSFPVHPQPMPLVPIQDTMMARTVLPVPSDSKMYVPQNKHMVPSYSDKGETLDHRGPHPRGSNKKKQRPSREKYSYAVTEPIEYNSNNTMGCIDEYQMSHTLPQTSHLASVTVPVSLSATDPHTLSQQHVPYVIPHGFPAVASFFPGPSQMYYPYMYPGMYNYTGHPAPNFPHIVPTEPPITPDLLNKATNVEMSNSTMSPMLPVDVMNKPILNQVPNELYTQEKLSEQPEPSKNGVDAEAPVESHNSESCIANDGGNEVCDVACSVAEQSVVVEKELCKTETSIVENAHADKTSVSFPAASPDSKGPEMLQAKVPIAAQPADSKPTFASLFKTNSTSQNSVAQPVLTNHVELPAMPNKGDGLITGSKDIVPAELKEILSTIQLDHNSVHFVPRGLSNKGNWCYINATLQALLACPPFHNLMRRLPTVIGLKKENSVAPVTEAVVEFVHEFQPLENSKKATKGNGKISTTKSKEEIIFGEAFEPKYIFDMLQKNKREDFAKGRQEDAEEFLTWMLNQVHEEMVKIKSTDTKDSNLKNGDIAMSNGDIASNGDEALNDDDEWQVIGHKNKSCATRSLHSSPSPIVDIFGGQICSVLQHAGCNKSQILEPFFTLQLDIQAENVRCIKTALEGLAMKETLEGYTCSTTNQEIEASRRIMLEKLPRVLILHLKRFVYHEGVIKKLLKSIEFDFDLELSKDLLSHTGRLEKNRSYKLFSVVYHDGQDAAKGHYIADVYHDAYRCWLRADDAKLKSIEDNLVLKYDPPRVPYLLYYRRDDTII